MKLIVISNPTSIHSEAQIVNNLFNEGLRYFHLRKPNESEESVEKLLTQIHPSFYPNIALHQHHQLASKFGIKRLHFPEHQRMQTVKDELKIKTSKGFTISTSIHQIEDLEQVSFFNHVFYGPVFNSISKKGYESKVPADFELIKPQNAPNVIALGGITHQNLHQIKRMNFDGVALLGFIWQKPENVINQFKTIQSTLKIL
ncbi:thiamine phosphate synthase [Pedobacter alpinus]|uniref:Thiamine phosphate synthase n=1 Tax=Pedobacter alpinus TaxID=1590643 RepID=A0ABW5TSW5_9SPHI